MVAGASVLWRRRGQLFVTVIAKLMLSYSDDGVMTLVEPDPMLAGDPVGLNELAPMLPRCDVVVLAQPTIVPVRLLLRRAGKVLVEKRAPGRDVAALASRGTFTPRQANVFELPEQHDFGFFQAAPTDQRTDYLQGDEELVLEGIDPRRDRVVLRLPRLRPRVRLVIDGELTPVHFHLDSVGLDAPQRRCTLLFRGSTPVVDEGAVSRARAELLAEPEQSAPPPPPPLEDLYATVPLDVPVPSPTLHRTTPIETTPIETAPVDEAAETSLYETAPVGPNVLTKTLPFDPNAPPSPMSSVDETSASISSGTLDDTSSLAGALAPFDTEETPKSPISSAPDVDTAGHEERARELEAAERRRAEEAAQFAAEQKRAADEERAAAATKVANKRERAATLKNMLYGFKAPKKR